MEKQETAEIFSRSRKNCVLVNAMIIVFCFLDMDIGDLTIFGFSLKEAETWKGMVLVFVLWNYFNFRYVLAAINHVDRSLWRQSINRIYATVLSYNLYDKNGKKISNVTYSEAFVENDITKDIFQYTLRDAGEDGYLITVGDKKKEIENRYLTLEDRMAYGYDGTGRLPMALAEKLDKYYNFQYTSVASKTGKFIRLKTWLIWLFVRNEGWEYSFPFVLSTVAGLWMVASII